MNCHWWRETFSAMLDGEASAEETAAADAHIARCGACRASAERDARITRMVRGFVLEPGPPVDDVLVMLLRGRDPLRVSWGTRVCRWLAQMPRLAEQTRARMRGRVREALVPRIGVQRCAGAVGTEASRGTATAVTYLSLHVVGVAACGCAPTCGCGCQAGRSCRCRALAA
jgi:predicted anti-sigma-YlaC factor YlaD